MRVITLRRPGVCRSCGAALTVGDRAGWDDGTGTTTCVDCLLPSSESVDRGQAGASAARTSAAPPEPQHVRSWATGVPGEERVGHVLDSIEGIVALHDRKVPGSRANLDHLAVTPAGVWAIDSKRYPGARIELRDVGGLLRRDERLYVGGRDRTHLVESMAWQVEAVSKVLGELEETVGVRPLLCFVESTWGWLAKPFMVQDVTVCWPSALPDILARPGPLAAAEREWLAAALAEALPPA